MSFDSSKAIFLIDASAFVFRAYYALQPLSSKGRPSHAVAGFASMLFKILKDKKPKACVVVFDSKKPTFRKEIYSEYKANRTSPPPDISDQIKAVREMCEKGGFPILQEEGFEADDWIASFIENFKDKCPVGIVSSDKDLMTLVTDEVVIYDSFKDRILGPREVEEKWGVPAERLGDLLSLTGDSSDNIPGIPGVGPKTAVQIIQTVGSLKNLDKNLKKLPPKLQEKISANREGLELSQKLIALKTDLKLPFKQTPSLPKKFPAELTTFLHDWECDRILATYSDVLSPAAAGLVSNAEVSSQKPLEQVELLLAQSEEDLDQILAEIKKSKVFAFDVETSSFDRIEAELVGISFAPTLKKSWYIPFRHSGGKLSQKSVLTFLEKVFYSKDYRKIAHNLKYDLEILKREGFLIEGPLEDTMIEGHLSHADRRSFSLANLAQEFLGEQKGDLDALLKDTQNFADVPLEAAVGYAAKDTYLTLKLHEKFSAELEAQKQVDWLYRNVEIPLTRVLGGMEQTGILLDGKYLQNLSVGFHQRIEEIQKKIYEIAGGEFNIASPKQLQSVLFEKLKLKPTKKTKTGFSTDESVLEELSSEHPLPKLILEVRGLSKLTSTYVDVLPNLIAKKDGRLHTSYHQTGTQTGRLSSSDPNLQNIPIRSEEGLKIRQAFIAEKGFTLLSVDYSQVELRLFAHMSGDQNMTKAFKSGRDIHSETARLIFGAEGKEERSRAKAINFALLYGSSAFGLARQIESSMSEAKVFMEQYFATFPRFKEYMTELVELAKKKGYTETLFGRRRPIPDIQSRNPTLRGFAERIAINAPVQGTAADIMKSAMVRVYERIEKEKLKSRLLLQVHDELVLEVWNAEKDQVKDLVTEEMADLSKTPVKKLEVDLVVDSAWGSNWAEMG